MKRVREMGMQEWIYDMKPEDLPEEYVRWAGKEDIRFSKAIRNVLGKG